MNGYIFSNKTNGRDIFLCLWTSAIIKYSGEKNEIVDVDGEFVIKKGAKYILGRGLFEKSDFKGCRRSRFILL